MKLKHRISCQSKEGVRIKVIEIEVREGKASWIAGIVTVLFGILYGALCTIYPDKSSKSGMLYYLLVYPVAVLIILAGVWLCMAAKNRKLAVEDAVLCYTNSFGRKFPFLLSDIAYCRTAMENGGNRDFIKLYNAQDKILCKLEYNMRDSIMFFQYLIDNQVKIECSEKSDYLLKYMLNTTSISPEEIPKVVNDAHKEAKEIFRKWIEKNNRFGAEWKTGISAYLENEIESKKQLYEQTGCSVVDSLSDNLPEGYILSIESYLLKDGEFVIDGMGKPVCFDIKIIGVSKSMKVGGGQKISNYNSVADILLSRLEVLEVTLPRRRYHTEALVLKHELIDSL